MSVEILAMQLMANYPQLRELEVVRVKTVAAAVGIGVHPNGKRASRRSAANAIVAANLHEVGLASHVVLLSLNVHPVSGLTEAEAMRLEISVALT